MDAHIDLRIGISVDVPFHIWCVNLSATFYAANSAIHTKIKYIRLDFQFVKDWDESGRLKGNHIQTHSKRQVYLLIVISY